MLTHPPAIIRRSAHNISRSLISPNALRIMYRLRDNGFTARLVGGAVRDILIGKEPKDFDIVTDATPEQLKRLFRNCRLIGRRFRLAHLHFRDEIIEVATFRAASSGNEDTPVFVEEERAEENESEPLDDRLLVNEEGMLLRDNLFGTPHEDAWRRDFTVNALAYDIDSFAVIDYVGGMADLDERLIRPIGDPWARFTEDPVRMLRAVRLSAQLGFTIETSCWQAMTEMAGKIALAAPARLFDELLKLFLSGVAVECHRMLEECGLLAALLPDFHDWLLAEESDTIVYRLERLDRRVAGGIATSPQLFLALLFGGYLTSGRLGRNDDHASPQQRTDSAIAAFMQELSSRIHIPQRIIMRLREMLMLESRMALIPGRKPHNVIVRPAFTEALAYLHACGEQDHALAKSAAWWERFAAKQPTSEETATTAEGEPHRKKRRRRRRKKPQQDQS